MSPKAPDLPLFKSPPLKDWVVWLMILAMIAGVSAVLSDYSNPSVQPGVNGGMTGSEIIDLAFAVGFQAVLFGYVPAAIRRRRLQAKFA